MARLILIPLLLLALNAAAAAPPQPAGGTRFVALALHDVVDHAADTGDDGVTTERLVEFFDWLKGSGWTPVSLDDLEQAARGVRPLPQRAVLLTFDDGYRSLYTRVFPLVLAYRFPVVSALVGAWMDAAMEATVDYDGKPVPRSKFISWTEAREMQASGLVEFGSHGYGLHTGIPGNPQGNLMPAAVTRRHDPAAGYESAAAQHQRLLADARRMRELMQRELGRAPRAWIWPFGRYSQPGIDAVREAGFRFALTLDTGLADAETPMAVPRLYPGSDARLDAIESMILLRRGLPAAQRLVCLDPAQLWSADPAAADERLGRAIERLRRLGVTAVTIDALDAAGAAWFPNRHLPLRADLLSRIAWQLQTRAGVDVHIRLPATAALQRLGDAGRVSELFDDLGAMVPASGLLIDDAPRLADAARTTTATTGFSGKIWETRQARDRLSPASLDAPERLAIGAFRAVERHRPGLKLLLAVDEWPSGGPGSLPDLTLLRIATTGDSHTGLTDSALAVASRDRRAGLWFSSAQPPQATALATAARRVLVAGGSALGWCADDAVGDRPAAGVLAPDISASTFPVLF